MTALDLIKASLRKIRVLGEGETPSIGMAADAIVAFKMMLDDWGNQDLMLYNVNTTLFTLARGVSSYTIGEGYTVGSVTGTFIVGSYVKGATSTAVGYLAAKNGATYQLQTTGAFVTGEVINPYNVTAGTVDTGVSASLVAVPSWQAPRPTKIDSAFLRVGTEDTQIEINSLYDYNKIIAKTDLSDSPTNIAYITGYPNATVLIYPVPSAASSISLTFKRHFSDINNVSDQINLPNGYSRAIVYNLALELASEFGKAPDQSVVEMARDSIAWIKRTNMPEIACEFDASLNSSSNHSCILVG
jgi:hypothetical protein